MVIVRIGLLHLIQKTSISVVVLRILCIVLHVQHLPQILHPPQSEQLVVIIITLLNITTFDISTSAGCNMIVFCVVTEVTDFNTTMALKTID